MLYLCCTNQPLYVAPLFVSDLSTTNSHEMSVQAFHMIKLLCLGQR
jgi:hypothetical protein